MPMPAARAKHGIAACNGRLYIIGGCSPAGGGERPTAAVHGYDVRAGKWTDEPSLPRALESLAAVAVGGQVHVIGGLSGGGGLSGSPRMASEPRGRPRSQQGLNSSSPSGSGGGAGVGGSASSLSAVGGAVPPTVLPTSSLLASPAGWPVVGTSGGSLTSSVVMRPGGALDRGGGGGRT